MSVIRIEAFGRSQEVRNVPPSHHCPVLVLVSGITLTSFFVVLTASPEGHETVSTLKRGPIRTTAKLSHCLRSGFYVLFAFLLLVGYLTEYDISSPRPPLFRISGRMNLVLIAPDHVPFIFLAPWACSCHAAPHWLINSGSIQGTGPGLMV